MTKPNHTQVANDFIDVHMRNLSGPAVKVCLVIFRRTIGWHKDTVSCFDFPARRTNGLIKSARYQINSGAPAGRSHHGRAVSRADDRIRDSL